MATKKKVLEVEESVLDTLDADPVDHTEEIAKELLSDPIPQDKTDTAEIEPVSATQYVEDPDVIAQLRGYHRAQGAPQMIVFNGYKYFVEDHGDNGGIKFIRSGPVARNRFDKYAQSSFGNQ